MNANTRWLAFVRSLASLASAVCLSAVRTYITCWPFRSDLLCLDIFFFLNEEDESVESPVSRSLHILIHTTVDIQSASLALDTGFILDRVLSDGIGKRRRSFLTNRRKRERARDTEGRKVTETWITWNILISRREAVMTIVEGKRFSKWMKRWSSLEERID